MDFTLLTVHSSARHPVGHLVSQSAGHSDTWPGVHSADKFVQIDRPRANALTAANYFQRRLSAATYLMPDVTSLSMPAGSVDVGGCQSDVLRDRRTTVVLVVFVSPDRRVVSVYSGRCRFTPSITVELTDSYTADRARCRRMMAMRMRAAGKMCHAHAHIHGGTELTLTGRPPIYGGCDLMASGRRYLHVNGACHSAGQWRSVRYYSAGLYVQRNVTRRHPTPFMRSCRQSIAGRLL